jgi:hypothetical protein
LHWERLKLAKRNATVNEISRFVSHSFYGCYTIDFSQEEVLDINRVAMYRYAENVERYSTSRGAV